MDTRKTHLHFWQVHTWYAVLVLYGVLSGLANHLAWNRFTHLKMSQHLVMRRLDIPVIRKPEPHYIVDLHRTPTQALVP